MSLAHCVSQGVLVGVVVTVVPPYGTLNNSENQGEGQESSDQGQDDQFLRLLAQLSGFCHVIFLLSNVKLLLGFHGIYHSWNSTWEEQNYSDNGENGEKSQIFFPEFALGTGGVIWRRNYDATSVFPRHYALFLRKQNFALVVQLTTTACQNKNKKAQTHQDICPKEKEIPEKEELFGGLIFFVLWMLGSFVNL